MRCPKPKVRGSINQLLPTGPLGTGDSGMGRVVKPEEHEAEIRKYYNIRQYGSSVIMLVCCSPGRNFILYFISNLSGTYIPTLC